MIFPVKELFWSRQILDEKKHWTEALICACPWDKKKRLMFLLVLAGGYFTRGPKPHVHPSSWFLHVFLTRKHKMERTMTHRITTPRSSWANGPKTVSPKECLTKFPITERRRNAAAQTKREVEYQKRQKTYSAQCVIHKSKIVCSGRWFPTNKKTIHQAVGSTHETQLSSAKKTERLVGNKFSPTYSPLTCNHTRRDSAVQEEKCCKHVTLRVKNIGVGTRTIIIPCVRAIQRQKTLIDAVKTPEKHYVTCQHSHTKEKV